MCTSAQAAWLLAIPVRPAVREQRKPTPFLQLMLKRTWDWEAGGGGRRAVSPACLDVASWPH